ncbi:polyphosphate kinase [Saccharobesus litoralis]|uniref:Polyphosphate kinase n=1 Tax=Saccharobesus litoralis TaxID=2172099 RepID=A0A2S0VW39_9ALTE|nr:PPK2 family polyphosphate kinase [Saccharobesus litoralis]AWB68437.1 polyphosphate kinase [Saccharobesus litoralis]
MFKPSPIHLVTEPAQITDITDLKPERSFANKATYYKLLAKLQYQLLLIQQAYFHQGRRAILVFEGWDASGKGGAIRRITEKLDPRGFRVYPIAAPKHEEQGRHYLYRFQTKLPKPGTISIFDRSYYGRVLVERIEGFASKQEWQRAYQEINEFERLLSDDGVRIVKFFLHISPEEQLKRFKQRLNDPHKRWKLTSEDLRNREKWPEYEKAINQMLAYTSTNHADWHLVNANNKKQTRLVVLETIIAQLSEGVDISPPAIDKELVRQAKKMLGI